MRPIVYSLPLSYDVIIHVTQHKIIFYSTSRWYLYPYAWCSEACVGADRLVESMWCRKAYWLYNTVMDYTVSQCFTFPALFIFSSFTIIFVVTDKVILLLLQQVGDLDCGIRRPAAGFRINSHKLLKSRARGPGGLGLWNSPAGGRVSHKFA